MDRVGNSHPVSLNQTSNADNSPTSIRRGYSPVMEMMGRIAAESFPDTGTFQTQGLPTGASEQTVESLLIQVEQLYREDNDMIRDYEPALVRLSHRHREEESSDDDSIASAEKKVEATLEQLEPLARRNNQVASSAVQQYSLLAEMADDSDSVSSSETILDQYVSQLKHFQTSGNPLIHRGAQQTAPITQAVVEQVSRASMFDDSLASSLSRDLNLDLPDDPEMSLFFQQMGEIVQEPMSEDEFVNSMFTNEQTAPSPPSRQPNEKKFSP